MTSDAPPTPPAGFARLAGRIGGWTTKGLLTAVILVGALGFGRQVLVWWSEDEGPGRAPDPAANPFAGLGDESREHELRFGEQPWSMRRQSISGDAKAAAAVLREKCREATASARYSAAPCGPQELKLLESLAGRAPVARDGGWAVYQLDEAVPMVVGVIEAGPEKGDKSNLPRSGPEGASHKLDSSPFSERDGTLVAQSDLRVVSWGFGVPGAEGGWTLYTFVTASPSGGSRQGAGLVPLPPECTRTLSLQAAEGACLVTFRGPRQPETWKAFYDQHFRTRGWRAEGRWRQTAGRWSNRFAEGPGADAAAVEVQFGPDEQGGMTGLLWIAPAAVPRKESEGL